MWRSACLEACLPSRYSDHVWQLDRVAQQQYMDKLKVCECQQIYDLPVSRSALASFVKQRFKWLAWCLVCQQCLIFGRPFVKRFALCYRTVVCLVCPVCDVGVLWPNGWTHQDETWHAGRPRPGHIVLDGDPGSLPQSCTTPPIFGPYLLWPNGSMAQDATW